MNQALAAVMREIVPKQVNDKLLAQHKELQQLRNDLTKIKEVSGCFVCSICHIVDSEDDPFRCTECNQETCYDCCNNQEFSCQQCGRDLYCSAICAEGKSRLCSTCTDFQQIRQQADKLFSDIAAAQEVATRLVGELKKREF